MRIVFSSILLSACALLIQAAAPVHNLSVSLRGKKYEIPDGVTTVGDLQDHLSAVSGVDKALQGRVIFGGKKLDESAVLSEAGVTDGASLNLVPPTSSSSSKKKKSAAAASSTVSTSTETTTDSSKMMKDYLQKAGVDPAQMEELMAGMSPDGKTPSMKESLDMMSEMMQSPIFKEYLNDPEKLEQSRQMILNNPMLKSMMAGMPGMGDLLNDPVAWKEAMQAAASMYSSMDSDQMMAMMNSMGGAGAGGMGGMGGMPPGLFDGTLDNSAATAALDELDEDD